MATRQANRATTQTGNIARSATLALPAWGILLLVTGASRLPFVRSTPINWDAVQFALAINHFDLHSHQPHPPGYILYVLAGRALNLLLSEPSLALSLLSVLACALSLPLFHGLAMRLFDDPTIARGAVLLLAASPLTLYYGSVGLTYMPEMLLSIITAALCWRIKTSAHRHSYLIILLALVLALASGVRQTSLPLMIPICLWALWGVGRLWAPFCLTLVGASLLWLVPLLTLSGGIAAYLRENSLLASAVVSHTSVFDVGLQGLFYNASFISLAVVIGLGLGLVPLGLWALRITRFSLARPARAFLALWIAPALVFYLLSHVGQYGYLLVVLPPLAILSAIAARMFGLLLAGERPRLARRLNAQSLGMAICLAASLFSLSYFSLAEGPITASASAGNDAHWRALQARVSTYDPSTTVLVMDMAWAGSFRQAGYLLPRYRSYGIDLNRNGDLKWLYSSYNGTSDYALPMPEGQDRVDLPPGTRTVVALDPVTVDRITPQGVLDCVPLADGSTLYVLRIEGQGHAAQALQALDIKDDKITLVRISSSSPNP